MRQDTFDLHNFIIGEDDSYSVSPVMINPFDPPQPIFWLICPTHQV